MKIGETRNTPEVDLSFANGDKGTGKGRIRGALYQGRTFEFFEKIESHLRNELTNHHGRIYEIEIELYDFPTTAEGALLALLTTLHEFAGNGANVRVVWIYNGKSAKQKHIAQELSTDFGRDKNGRPFLTIEESRHEYD